MKQISRDNKMYNKFKATERRDSDNMSPQIVVRRYENVNIMNTDYNV